MPVEGLELPAHRPEVVGRVGEVGGGAVDDPLEQLARQPPSRAGR
jgi:hypothetical protein